MNSFELSCTIFGESLMWEGSQQGDGRQVNISHPTWEPDTQNRYRTGIENLDRLTWAQQGSELRTIRLHYTSLSKILAEKPGVVMNNSNTINYLQEIDNMLIHLKQTFKYYTVSSLPVRLASSCPHFGDLNIPGCVWGHGAQADTCHLSGWIWLIARCCEHSRILSHCTGDLEKEICIPNASPLLLT